MKISSFEELINHDINITDIVCLEQHWRSSDNFYSYMARPRGNNGILFVREGKAVYSAQGGDTVKVSRGDIIFLPKGAHYFVRFTEVPSVTVLINFFIRDGRNNELVLFENVSRLLNDTSGITNELFSEIWNLYLKTSNKLMIKSKVLELLNFIIRQKRKQENPSAILPAVDYIANHLNDVIKIPTLSKLCALSESSFRRKFISETGMTAGRYIQNEKIKKARQLLSIDEFSISEICEALGYYDNAHFSKVFKAVTGKTPAQYRISVIPKKQADKA